MIALVVTPDALEVRLRAFGDLPSLGFGKRVRSGDGDPPRSHRLGQFALQVERCPLTSIGQPVPALAFTI